ncbi:MAG: hypothetical protein ACHQZQ_04305 [SAR324 cluster bacterium]
MSGIDIVEAMGIMCRHPEHISDVVKETVDFFSFKYVGKQVWSVAKPHAEEVWVRFYPGALRFDANSEYIEYRKSDYLGEYRQSDALVDAMRKHEVGRAFEKLFEVVRDMHYRVGDAMEEIRRSDRVSAK